MPTRHPSAPPARCAGSGGEPLAAALDADRVRSWVPARSDVAHKGTSGSVLCICGSLLYPGAAALTSAAAARAGTGLVAVALPIVRGAPAAPAWSAPLLSDTIRHALPWTARRHRPGVGTAELVQSGHWGAAAADAVLAGGQVRAVLIGNGLGTAPPPTAFLRRWLQILRSGADAPTLIVDGDGLTGLSRIPAWWRDLPGDRLILTPHPTERRRLLEAAGLGSDVPAVAGLWNQVLVAKDAQTSVWRGSDLLGTFAGHIPALATAGSGDVLAGIIAGLVAQGAPPHQAAAAGVVLHGEAGRLLQTDYGTSGGLASDLLERIPRARRQVTGTA
jgi:NAD(P)H-hydrate repair Nnr-like enzyme with NAD(P)H-hydrate dehydratase domain